MDTRLLYVLSIVVATTAAVYYYYSGKVVSPDVRYTQDLSQVARFIQLTQTNENGQLHVKAHADSLQQWMKQKTAKLSNLQATLYEDNQPLAQFKADELYSYNDNQQLELKDNVIVSKLNPDHTTNLSLYTGKLRAFPKTHIIETDQAVTIKNQQSQFSSQGLNANLKEGLYNFYGIRGQYEPAL